MLNHLQRWLTDHTQLPTVTVPSAAVDDDDTEAWGDLRYMRELADDFLEMARATAANIACPLIEQTLAGRMIGDDYQVAS